mmetsp:Transcript_3805/g.5820  ORF Transcript_3805/g.5820 Transcript_3805/m.5820 type:complete len:132 (-) Transcript_3805:248-643(-)
MCLFALILAHGLCIILSLIFQARSFSFLSSVLPWAIHGNRNSIWAGEQEPRKDSGGNSKRTYKTTRCRNNHDSQDHFDNSDGYNKRQHGQEAVNNEHGVHDGKNNVSSCPFILLVVLHFWHMQNWHTARQA